MSRPLPFCRTSALALFIAVAALPGGTASAAGTVECIAALGPGGQAMRVTMRTSAGHCPRLGEAIPTELVVGRPVPLHPVRLAAATAPPPTASNYGIGVGRGALTATDRVAVAVAAARAQAGLPPLAIPVAAVVSERETLDAPRVEFKSIPLKGLALVLLAFVGSLGLLAGPGGQVRWTA